MPEPVPQARSGTRLLCYSGYAAFHSGETRTALWAAEHLTPEKARRAEILSRPNPEPFRPDANLPPGRRAELRDYRGSGFDRGHVAPSGDMATITAQSQSYSLANMVPQDPCNNRGLWRKLEAAILRLAEDGAELYVITGPIFAADPADSIGRGVKVPTHVFKAVLTTGSNGAAAYVVLNNDVTPVEQISIAELEARTGFDVFPTLSAAAKRTAAALPPMADVTVPCRR